MVRIQWFNEFEKTLPGMSGLRIAITGTSSGVGLVAATTCAKKGAEVFMLNRPSKRAESALRQVREACPGAPVHHIACDLTDFASVRQAAASLREALGDGGLDVLCNNAGIMDFPDEATKDGFDIQMQTNHLSHFLLTKEMLPALQRATELRGGARIVHQSSVARKGKPLEAKYFGPNGGKLGDSRYQQSKLANLVYTYALSDRLAAAGPASAGIKAICVTPGVSATNLFDEGSWLVKLVVRCSWQSVEDGTMGLLYGIASKDAQTGDLAVPDRCGEFKGPLKIIRRPPRTPAMQASMDLLWRESEKAVSETFEI